MINVIHIINPIGKDNKELYKAQLVTLESIRNALNLVDTRAINVKLYSLNFMDEAYSSTSTKFENLHTLKRSILDIAQFKYRKKLPLLVDLIQAYPIESQEPDYIIYSNIDIALMPHFYQTIAHYLTKGYDSIAINRRTISNKYSNASELPLMYSAIGTDHEGIDCFVFSEEILRKSKFFHSFIGSGPVGLCFIVNIIVSCKNFIWIENSHLTFHIGDDKEWNKSKYNDYQIKNFEELINICTYHLKLPSNNLTKLKRIMIEEIYYFAKNHTELLRTGKYNKYGRRNPKRLLHYYSNLEYDKIIQNRKEFGFLFHILNRLCQILCKSKKHERQIGPQI